MIHCKRVYDDVAPDDGFRVLVDRLWPRGVRKENLSMDWWARIAAPSDELRRWIHSHPDRWEEFVARYRTELEGRRGELERLTDAAVSGTVTLLYAARDRERNHALVLREWLQTVVHTL